MKTKEKYLQEVVEYEPPCFNVTDITLEQNVLANGSGEGTGNLNDLSGEYW